MRPLAELRVMWRLYLAELVFRGDLGETLRDAVAERARTLLPRVEAELGTRAAAPYRIALIPPGTPDDPVLRDLEARAPPWAAGFMIPALRAGAIRIAEADRYPFSDLGSVLDLFAIGPV